MFLHMSNMQKKETSIFKKGKRSFRHATGMLSYLIFEGLSIALLSVVIWLRNDKDIDEKSTFDTVSVRCNWQSGRNL